MDSAPFLDDFKKAVVQLDSALKLEADNDVMKAGCIQYFEFSFELAWKTIKAFAEREGLIVNSHKEALKAAFTFKWIEDDEPWLDMLASRNKMSHTYSASSAIAIYEKLPEYLAELKKLTEALAAIAAEKQQTSTNQIDPQMPL